MSTTSTATDWRLCRTGGSLWTGTFSSALLDDWGHLEELERGFGIGEGQRFLLRPDGSSDRDVSCYFASSEFRRLARGSQVSYATDLKVFLSFLERLGVNWRDATHDTLLDYDYWRRKDDRNPRRVSGAKFARELAAVSHFYRWQVRRGTVASSPVRSIPVRDRRGDIVLRSQIQPANVRSVKVKWLTPRAYRRWRDVGLGGYGSDGLPDTSWRGRNDGRNLAMSDFMWASGLRLREAGIILLPELPESTGAEQYVRGRVAEAVAKGRAREYWVSRRALHRVKTYVSTTRADAVRRARAAGRYDDNGGQLLVESVSHRGDITYQDGRGQLSRTHVDLLDDQARLLLFRETPEGLEPLSLWLTESGTAMPYLTWEAVFAQATARCKAQEVPIACHPHMLRHSFALRMLVTLIHAFDRRLGLSEQERLEYRHLFGDPWVLVQTMLGHAHLSTTRAYYLEPVQGLQVDMFLNAETDDDSIQDLIARIAQTSPRIQDHE